MKKNSFLEGALVTTIGIVLCKIIGLIYVIPFYALIGQRGGTLYGYAYSIYALFLSLSSVGIPVAMSKIVSEYIALDYYHTKERAFKIGATILIGLGLFFFVFMLIFAPNIAYLMIDDLEGGNTISAISTVIRIIATALLIVPLFSVTKGYLQGHKIMTAPSIANVIEQLVRVIIIVGGSFIIIKILHLPVNVAVGIAVFGATVGALAGFLYVYYQIRKNRAELKKVTTIKEEEKTITKRDIVKKIIFYAIPFITIDLINSAYSMVDTFTIVRTMNNLGYPASISEATYGILSTWGAKLNMIVISIAIGMCISLIPNITSSFVKKDYKDLNSKINQSIQSLFFICLPMTFGLAFLAKPVWIIFYGYDAFSINLFRIFIFQSLSFSIYSILIDILQAMNDSKIALSTLFLGFIGKAALNIPIMYLCKKIGIGAYYGPVFATIFMQLISTFILLLVLRKRHKIRYRESFVRVSKVISSTILMIVSLYLFSKMFPLTLTSRLGAIFECVFYVALGVWVFGFTAYQYNLFDEILGRNFITRIFGNFIPLPKKDK